MNEKVPAQNHTIADTQQQERFIRILVFALIFSAFAAVASLVANVTSFQYKFDSTGRTSNVTHHTLTSRVALVAATAFHVWLAYGFVRRQRAAWRAAIALPLLWAFLVATMNWERFYHGIMDRTVMLPVALIAGIGVWQTLAFRRQLAVCEGLFA